jgi:hypothetical protein
VKDEFLPIEVIGIIKGIPIFDSIFELHCFGDLMRLGVIHTHWNHQQQNHAILPQEASKILESALLGEGIYGHIVCIGIISSKF